MNAGPGVGGDFQSGPRLRTPLTAVRRTAPRVYELSGDLLRISLEPRNGNGDKKEGSPATARADVIWGLRWNCLALVKVQERPSRKNGD